MSGATRLPRAWFAHHALEVAPALVGVLLERTAPDGTLLRARITETEAYTEDDPACHAHRRRTPRNEPLFGPPGHAYVYRTYGIHWCLNVATGPDGEAQGVLVRAAEPLAGLAVLRARRGQRTPDRDLLRGPGRLTQALEVHGEHTGADLCGQDPPLVLRDDGARPAVARGPRVGVSRAADWPWRFTAVGSRFVSPYTRSPRAPRAAEGSAAGEQPS